ncbi:MAG: extracellular solute-binding protein [Lachnospiraceae bacterium]|nr:extracellular solute-binding protein [Lachnospiraceae bacterium]
MKKKIGRVLVVSLLAIATMTMVACGKKKETNEHKIDKNAIYKEVDLGIQFPEGVEINSAHVKDGRLYANGYSFEEGYAQKLITCNLDGSDMRTFGFSDPNAYIEIMTPLKDGKIVIFYTSYEEIVTEDTYDYNTYYYATIVDENGKFGEKVDLTDKIEYVSNVQVLDDKILVFSDDKIYTLDHSLNFVSEKEFENINFGRMFALRGDKMLISSWGEEKEEYRTLDLKTLELSDVLTLAVNMNLYDISAGSQYDLILRDNVSVYGFNLKDTEPKVLVNFVDSDISVSYFSSFDAIDDRTFVGAYYDYDSDDGRGAYKLAKYEKVNPEDVVEKQILTLGCLYLDNNVRKQVIHFNKTNENYRIRVIDYSSYNTEDDWDAGSKKFNSDVASGKGPDIVIASDSTTIHNYISKGLYYDMNSLLDNDPEIKREDLFPNVIKMGSYDGKLYEIIPSFYIETVVGKKSILGDRQGWTMKEMMEFEKTIPEKSSLIMGVTRNEFVNNMLAVNSSVYVDMASGKCSFDSDDFRGLLEYAKTLPEGDDDYYNQLEEEGFWESYEEMWLSNRAILMPTTIYSLSDYNQILKGYIGEDITFIGYPSEDRKGSSAYYYFSLGISSKCPSPESAWEFVRTYLLAEYQNGLQYNGVPISMSAFDEIAKKAMNRNAGGGDEDILYEDTDTFYINGEYITIKPLTADEIKKYKDFILTVDKSQGSLSDVDLIIDEETQGYFQGDKSLDDVVKNIQGRVQLFISEKR